MAKGITKQRSFSLGELALTQKRVGIEPMERLRWALGFAQEAPDQRYTSLDEDAKCLELYAFANSLVFWDRLPAAIRAELRQQYESYNADASYITSRGGEWLPNYPEVRAIRDLFRTMIEDFVNGKEIRQQGYRSTQMRLSLKDLESDSLSYHQSLAEQWADHLGAHPPYWKFPFRQFHFAEEARETKERFRQLKVRLMSLENLFDLLSEAPPNSLRRCAANHPGGIFFSTKPKATWCRDACGNRFRVAKSRRPKG